MLVGEALRFSWEALQANRLRTALTALGLVIGNASVILVVTISVTSREYILDQIRGIGSNIIYAYYEAGSKAGAEVEADYIKLADVEAVRRNLQGRIVAATGVMTVYDRMMVQGRERDIKVIGSDEHYAAVRNLVLVAGRSLDKLDVDNRQRVALLTVPLAQQLYGFPAAAIGQRLKIHGLEFTVIGVFRERTESFGLSELSRETVLIPISVIRYFSPVERIDPMYVQARQASEVESLTLAVRSLLESRHRPGARYVVENLRAILEAANRIALVLTLVLVMISAISLVISGIGIMNIMLVTVTERTREIGIRMSVGARRRDILQQFLLEAVLISTVGGMLGILVGVAIPWLASRALEGLRIPIPVVGVVIAFGTSFAVGLIFGLLPANRAARLNPAEALRYE